MPGPIHDVMFRLLGDESGARRALERVAAELEAYASIRAEAEAELETGEAIVKLERLEKRLEVMDGSTSTPEIKLDIALVTAQVRALRQDLERLDREDVTIDVHLRRGILDRMQGLTRQVTAFGRASRLASPEVRDFGDQILGSTVNMGPFTTQLKVAGPILVVLSSALVALVAALGALIASLSLAVLAIGALTVAFVGALIPAVGLAFTAFKRFQQQSEKAGTAAHALARAWEGVQKVFKTLLPAADPVIRAFAEILRVAGQLARVIRPAFVEFGKAVGDAFGLIAEALRSPEMRAGIRDLIRLSADVFPPLIRASIALFRIFMNIARAAMPLLVAGLEAMADALEGIAGGTENISGLRRDIAGLVVHLEAWLDLIWQISRVFGNFVRAMAPAGLELVRWLSDGAKALADWAGSAEGQERIQEFMENMLPLAKELIILIAKLTVTFLKVGEATAPILLPIIEALNGLLDIIAALADAFNLIPQPIREFLSVVILLLAPWAKIRLVTQALVIAFGFLNVSVKGAIDLFMDLAGAVLSAGKVVGKLAVTLATGLAGAVKEAIRFVGRFVSRLARGFARGVVEALRFAGRFVANLARGFAKGITEAIRFVGRFASNLARGFARGVREAVRFAGRFVSNIARGLGRVVSEAGRFAGRFASLIGNGVSRAVSAAGRFVGDFFRAGVNLIRGLINGIRSMIDDAVGAARDLADRVKDEVTSLFGLLSPSSVMRGYGRDIVRGFTQGIEELSGEPARALADLADGMRMQVGVGAATAVGGGVGGGIAPLTQNFNVTTPAIAGRPDPRVIAAQLALLERQRGGGRR